MKFLYSLVGIGVSAMVSCGSFAQSGDSLECTYAGYLSSIEFFDSGQSSAATHVSAEADVAFVISRGRLLSVDVSDPYDMTTIGLLDSPEIQHAMYLHVLHGYAYIGAREPATGASWVHIVEVADPAAMRVAGSVQVASFSDEFGVFGQYMYAAGSTRNLSIIDVADPASPFIASTYTDDSSFIESPVVTHGYLVYRTTGGLVKAVDVSDPQSTELLSTFDPDVGRDPELAIGSDLVVYAVSETELAIVDYSSPESPALIAEYVLDSLLEGDVIYALRDVEVDGGTLILAYNNGVLVTIDVSNPAESVHVGRLVTPGLARDLHIDNGLVFVADIVPGLTVVDPDAFGLPDPSVGRAGLDNLNSAHSIDVIDDIAYLASEDYGILPYDISNPTAPTLIGAGYGADTKLQSVAYFGGFAYVYREDIGLDVVNFQDPASPSLYGQIEFDEEVREIAQGGSLACVRLSGSERSSYVLLDLSTSPEPVPLGEIDPSCNSGCSVLALRNQELYIEDYVKKGPDQDRFAELIRFDLSKQGFPESRRVLPIENRIEVLEVGKDVLFASSREVLYVIDRNDFSVLNSFQFFTDVCSLKARSDRLYVGLALDQMSVFDISIESQPRYLAATAMRSSPEDIAITDSLAYVASEDFGLEIVNVGEDCGACDVDLTGDGMLNFFDVTAFIVAYMQDDPVADFNDDSDLDYVDVSLFLKSYQQGCP